MLLFSIIFLFFGIGLISIIEEGCLMISKGLSDIAEAIRESNYD